MVRKWAPESTKIGLFMNQGPDFGPEGWVTDVMHPIIQLIEGDLAFAYLYVKSTCLGPLSLTCYFLLTETLGFYIHFIATMSGPWIAPAQQVENPLDSTLSDFLTFDLLDHLDPVEPVFDIMPGTNSMPSDTTFDWSSGINPTLCVLPSPDQFVNETPPGNDSTSSQTTAHEQSLREAMLRLEHRFDILERGMEARLAQIEDNIGAMGQRLTKIEEAKETQDIEYAFTPLLSM
jgi:hypothetical protein